MSCKTTKTAQHEHQTTVQQHDTTMQTVSDKAVQQTTGQRELQITTDEHTHTDEATVTIEERYDSTGTLRQRVTKSNWKTLQQDRHQEENIQDSTTTEQKSTSTAVQVQMSHSENEAITHDTTKTKREGGCNTTLLMTLLMLAAIGIAAYRYMKEK